MGAANAIRAYATYGDTVSDHAMRVLVYMALVARDGDAEPWFGLGQEALSELALGRKVPGEDEDPHGRAAALKAVRRAMTDLQKAGAIRTAARARFGAHQSQNARYRLYLDTPCPEDYRPPKKKQQSPPDAERPMAADAGRPVDDDGLTAAPPDAERPMAPGASGPMADETTGRFVSSHRTFRGQPPDAERPTKEKEEKEERRNLTSVACPKVEGAHSSRRPDQDRPIQSPLVTVLPGGAVPGHKSHWRDPEALAREQVAESQRRRAAPEGSAAS